MKPTILFDVDDTLINTTEAVITYYHPNAQPNKIASLVRKNTEWDFTTTCPDYTPAVYDEPGFQRLLRVHPTFPILEATLLKDFNVVLGTAGSQEYNAFKQSMFPTHNMHFFRSMNKSGYPCDIQIDDRASCLASEATLKILLKPRDTEYNQDPPHDAYIIQSLYELPDILAFYLQHQSFYL